MTKNRKIGAYVKYIFAILITVYSYHTTHDVTFIGMSFVELAGIFFVLNFLLKKNEILGNIVGFILHLLYDAQMIVLNFGGVFTTWVMLTNLASLEDLSGKAFEYIGAILIMLLIMLMPIHSVDIDESRSIRIWALLVFFEVTFTYGVGKAYAPYSGVGELYQQYKEQNMMHETVAMLQQQQQNARSVSNDQEQPFYRSEISGGIDKPECLPENPNIIWIFTEAFSANIMEDERDIMPNIKAFSDECISFSNYYNHTFATYRALIGQLYSGHQLENMDENHLISIFDILEDKGYQTTMINVEPLNEDFSEYLARFPQQSMDIDIPLATLYGTVPDQTAYQVLFNTAMEKHREGIPFCLSMYTVGTHASFTSPGIVFDNGANDFLNKYHYTDASFEVFLHLFKNSELYDDTILILTADHACYAEEDFLTSFPEYDREFADCDRIPLLIYFKGITPANYDVNGRNSLDIAPTILDLLDISEPNYFLGNSLFLDEENSEPIEYLFYDSTSKQETKGGHVKDISDENKQLLDKIVTGYCAIK